MRQVALGKFMPGGPNGGFAMRYDDVSQGTGHEDMGTLARADVDSLPAGVTGPATGNAITGTGTITGQAGADSVETPPGSIVAIQGAGGAASGANGEFVVHGQYGTLTIEADGSYSYVRNAGAPDGVDDVFTYTLADSAGHRSTNTLTIELGLEVQSEAANAALSNIPGVVNLPAGVTLSDIHVVGRDLVIDLPDGTHMTIPGGAVFVPQLVIGDVEVPPTNLAALLIDSEPQPAAGPPQSSGNNFATDVPPLDPGIPLGDLLPPTELAFTPPDFEEDNQFINNEPTVVIETPDNPAGAVDAQDHVSEAGLPARPGESEGSDAAANSEATTGTIVFDAVDGLDNVSINGVAIDHVGQQFAGAQGTLTITSIDLASGEITYSYAIADNTNPGGDNISDHFDVVVTDSDGDTSTATLTVHIEDDHPTANDDSGSQAAQDAPVTVNVIANDVQGADSVANGDIQLVAGSLSGTGTLVNNGDGTFTYTPAAGESDDVTFDYRITDGDGDTSTATVTIHLIADSEPTVSVSGDNSVDEAALSFGSNPGSDAETAVGTINVDTGNDSISKLVIDNVDVTNGGTVTGTSGTLTVTHNADGTYGYSYMLTDATTDVANQPEVDSFAVTVTDSDGDTASTTLNIDIADDVPTAHDDSGTQAAENAPITVDVIANDVPGADGVANGDIELVAGTLSGSGTLAYNGDGTFTYTPSAGEEGAVTFDYQITDGDGDTSTATVTIDLLADSVPTVSVLGGNSVDEAGLPTGSNPGADSETAAGTININTGSDSVAKLVIDNVDVTNGGTVSGASGTLTVTHNADGSYGYSYTLTSPTTDVPNQDEVESFLVTVTDSDGDTASKTVGVTIVDDVPTAVDDSGSQTVEDAPITVNVIANDVQGADSVPNNQISYVSGSLSGGAGSVTYNGDGTFTYAPVAGETGTVTFDYQIVDADGDPSTATVTINLLGDSEPTVSVSGDNSVDEAALPIGSNPGSDAETAAGSINIDTGNDSISKLVIDNVDVTNGGSVNGDSGTLTVTHNADGTYSYSYTLTSPTTDVANQAEVDSFAVTVTDSDGDTASTNLNISIVDDVPTAHADSGSVNEGGTLIVDAASGVLSNDVLGADGAAVGGAVTGVQAGTDTSNAVSGGVGSSIVGAYGTLTLGADGSYVYVANPNSVTSNQVDHFVYTITDGDGDTSTVTLDINVNNVTLPGDNQVKSVDEAALDTTTSGNDLGHGSVSGSNPGSTAETITGQLNVAGATSYDTQDVTTAHGIFHLNADGSYTYTLTSPVDGATANNGTDTINGVDQFTYTAHDGNGNAVNGTVTINVVDDVPTAHADSGNVNEGSALVVNAAGGVLSNDLLGADGGAPGGAVTGVATGSNTSSPVSGNVATDIVGTYGTLHLNADGSYTYTSNANAITSDATDHFVYTITDGDGDKSTTTLDINVNDVTLAANNQIKTVSEAALDTTTSGNDLGHGSVSGSNPGSAAETVTGQIAVSGATGYTPQDVTTANGIFHLNADGSYTYTLTSPVDEATANNGADTQNGVDQFTYTAHDAGGNTVTGTVTINVTDDVPTAHADTGSVSEGALLSVNVANGVLSNDVLGADGGAPGGTVTGVATGSNTSSPVSGNVGTDIAGTYGTLHLNADGSYTYSANPNSVTSNQVDHFVYTITDGDGDKSTTTLDINVSNVTLSADNQVKTVNEAALDTTTSGNDLGHASAIGSNPGSAAETVTGQLAVSGATGYTPQDVTTANGIFHLNADGSYTYTLTSPVDEATANNGTDTVNGVDQFTYTAHDAGGNTVTGTVTINVTDDVPTAHADSGNVTEGGVISVNAASGVLSNDVLGADGGAPGGTVTGVATGTNTASPVSGNVGTTIVGSYGTLQLFADGHYVYTANFDAVTANQVDHFVYTITDGDGDKSTTTLDINVANVSLAADNQVKTVNEAALDTTTSGSDLGHGSVTGSNPGSAAETVTGQLAVGGATGYTPQSVTTAHGIFQLNADGSYTYTLTDPVDEPTANNGADTVNGVESFTYTAHDANGNTVTGTVKINVVDDVPTLGTVQNQQTNNSPATAPAVGTLHFESGADGAGSTMTITANTTGITSGGHNLLTVQSGNVLTAYQDTNNDGIHQAGETTAVFTLTVDPNAGTSGQYTFDLLQALDPTLVDTPVGGTTSFGAGPQPYQVVSQTNVGVDPLAILTGWHTDASFNEADWFNGTNQLPAGVTIADINGSNAGWGVDNNNFTQGEFLRVDFGEPPDDFDGPGGYAPPNPAVNLPTISTATFETIGYASGGTFEFVLHYTDGTSSNATFSGAGTFTLTATGGKFIDWIDVYTPDAGSGKIDLVSVGVQSSSLDKTIGFGVQLSDGDGDLTSTGNFTVHVKDGLTPLAPAAPVVLDLNGDGVHFLSADDGVTYNYGDGTVATAWASPEDGILVRDANANGTVDSSSEFVFGHNGVSDLQALSAYDSNHDGQLSSADSGFSSFGVWQDANSNGVVDAGEYQSLAARGINAISLSTDEMSYEAANGDVQVVGTGSYTRADGSTGSLADAIFATSARAANDDLRTSTALSSNTLLIGAIAAAGLASEPLAAQPHFSADAMHVEAGATYAQAFAPVALESVSTEASSRVSELLSAHSETQFQQVTNESRQPVSTADSHLQLDSHSGPAAMTALVQATEAPTHGDFNAVSAIAGTEVAMPSAQQMAAFANIGGSAQGIDVQGTAHNQVVGKIIADSLAGGGGAHSAIDAVLNNLPSHNGANPAIDALATQVSANVPAWHAAAATGFGGAETVFSMETMMLHHDAVPPAHG